MHAVRVLPGEAFGGNLRYLDVGVAKHETQQLAAGVPGGAGDGTADHRSGERR